MYELYDHVDDQKYLNKCIKRAYKINRKFFDFDIKYKIKLFYSRKEFDKLWKEKTPRWICAGTTKDRIFVFAPSLLENLSTHKLKEYQNIITHEMSHLFFQKLVKTYKPYWLEEGLAMNMDGTKYKYKGKPNTKYLFYTFQIKKFFKNSKEFYRNSYLVTKILLKKLGKNKLLILLKRYSKNPVKRNYLKLFDNFLKNT